MVEIPVTADEAMLVKLDPILDEVTEPRTVDEGAKDVASSLLINPVGRVVNAVGRTVTADALPLNPEEKEGRMLAEAVGGQEDG